MQATSALLGGGTAPAEPPTQPRASGATGEVEKTRRSAGRRRANVRATRDEVSTVQSDSGGELLEAIATAEQDLDKMIRSSKEMIARTGDLIDSGEPLGPHMEPLDGNLAQAKEVYELTVETVSQEPGDDGELAVIRQKAFELKDLIAELERLSAELKSSVSNVSELTSPGVDDDSSAAATYAERLGLDDVIARYGIEGEKDDEIFATLWNAGYRAEHAPLLRTALSEGSNVSGTRSRDWKRGKKFWEAVLNALGGFYDWNGWHLPPAPGASPQEITPTRGMEILPRQDEPIAARRSSDRTKGEQIRNQFERLGEESQVDPEED